ncbi:MAG TPA: BACON domain-containing carbohydrate-binding protein, partial [Verrucomicrobiae bacterium]|nr:BACON domain-containing carbohydrate-binding protein [Verrucomicrobiae bacterium]
MRSTLFLLAWLASVVAAPSARAATSVTPPERAVSAKGGKVAASLRVTEQPGVAVPVSVQVDAPAGMITGLTGDGAAVPLRKGAGTAKIAFTVSANPGVAPRSATLTVNGAAMKVTQGGQSCAVTVRNQTPTVEATGGSGSIEVTAPDGCSWAASGSAGWIQFANPAGTGRGAATFTVAPNSGARRTGAITVTSFDEAKKKFTAKKLSMTQGAYAGGSGNTGGEPPKPLTLREKQVRALTIARRIASPSLGFALYLKEDGTVLAAGYGAYGSLGNGTEVDSYVPVPVEGLKDVVSVSAKDTSMALKADGTIWSWGYNGHGQLGNGTNTHSFVPVQVPDMAEVAAISAGDSFSLALKKDGTVWSWGGNAYHQLGDGTTLNRSTPAQVPGLSDIVAIAAGAMYSVAVKSDGTVWGWGDGPWLNISNEHPEPTQVTGVSDIVAVAAGTIRTVGLKSDGTVWEW